MKVTEWHSSAIETLFQTFQFTQSCHSVTFPDLSSTIFLTDGTNSSCDDSFCQERYKKGSNRSKIRLIYWMLFACDEIDQYVSKNSVFTKIEFFFSDILQTDIAFLVLYFFVTMVSMIFASKQLWYNEQNHIMLAFFGWKIYSSGKKHCR